LKERRYLTSIPGLKNLNTFLLKNKWELEFDRRISLIVEDEIINRFEPIKVNDGTPL
jgi:hypothetical protein